MTPSSRPAIVNDGMRAARRWWMGFGALCFLLAWLAPDHYEPWLGFYSEAPMFMALWVGCAALCAPWRPFVRFPHAGLLLAAALGVVLAAQWAAGQLAYHGHALLGLLYLAGMLMAWWLGASAVRLSPSVEWLLACGAGLLLCAAVASGGIELLQWLRMEDRLSLYAVESAPGVRPSGNLAQPNLQATLLLMGTVALALLWSMRRLWTWLAAVLLVFLSFALVLTESRAGVLGAAGIGALVLWRGAALHWAKGRRAVLLWWGLLPAFWWLREPLNAGLLLQPARELGLGVDNVRLVLWRQMLSAIGQSPWWGYGWNQTPVAQKFGVVAAPGEWTIDFSHNVTLDLLAWFGVPLGSALFGLVVWWVLRCGWRLRDRTQLLLLCIALPVLTHSLVEFPFAYSFFLFPVACVFGALHALQSPASFRIEPAPGNWLRLSVVAGLVLYAVVAGRAATEYWAAEEEWRILRVGGLGQRVPEHDAPDLLLLDQLGALLELGRMQPTPGMDADALGRTRDAALFHRGATLHLKHVLALGLNGQPQEASRQLMILRDLYGPRAYAQAKARFQVQRDTRYPELARVAVP